MKLLQPHRVRNTLLSIIDRMFEEDEYFLTEEEAEKILQESNILMNHPELKETDEQLIQLTRLNIRAVGMGDSKEYDPYLILAVFLTKICGNFNIEPLEVLEKIKIQIDEDRK